MNDLLKSINLRLNNPFILSFVIFWNWPIVVGLLWYNAKTLHLYGYPNYKALIMDNADVWRNYILPFCFAVAYPYLKLAFSALQTTVNAIDERNTKRLSAKGYISTTKFIEIRDNYELELKKLSELIEKEHEVHLENTKLNTELSGLKTDLMVQQEKVKILNDDAIQFKKRGEQLKDVIEGLEFNRDIAYNDLKLISTQSKLFVENSGWDILMSIEEFGEGRVGTISIIDNDVILQDEKIGDFGYGVINPISKEVVVNFNIRKDISSMNLLNEISYGRVLKDYKTIVFRTEVGEVQMIKVD